jgi:hypothetical protein
MSCKKEHDTTTNRSVYNKCHKQLYAGCSLCPWHRNENFDGQKRKPRVTPRYKSHRTI